MSPESEPIREQRSFIGKPQLAKRSPRHKKPDEQNVFVLLNEQKSWEYSRDKSLDTSLEYSHFELKPHQAHARQWMKSQENEKGMGGLLADEMGWVTGVLSIPCILSSFSLGKTIQMVVCIVDSRIKAHAEGKSGGPTL